MPFVVSQQIEVNISKCTVYSSIINFRAIVFIRNTIAMIRTENCQGITGSNFSNALSQ